MSSLASFRGLPGTPTYSASKALVRTWAEGMRPDYARLGVEINALCPGYVRSPMTDRNEFRMPFLMSADHAARVIGHHERFTRVDDEGPHQRVCAAQLADRGAVRNVTAIGADRDSDP